MFKTYKIANIEVSCFAYEILKCSLANIDQSMFSSTLSLSIFSIDAACITTECSMDSEDFI